MSHRATDLEGLHSGAGGITKLPPLHVILTRPEALLNQGHLQLVHMSAPIALS